MKKIIVFGASGDTGRYFIEYFLENYDGNEYEIIATGTRNTDFFNKLSVEYVQLDITRKDDFVKLPGNDVYAVVHLAGAMPARMKGYDPYKYIDVNIVGTLNILEYCRESGVDRILFAQSFGDIKDYGDKCLLTVGLPRKFSFTSDHTIYVMTKNFAVDMIENYHQMYGLKRFIFRLPTIYLYSPVDTYYVDGNIRRIGYRILIDRAINGEPIEVWGDPSRVKDMVYVKDFCQMLFKAIFVNREEGYYNVGTGTGTSLLDQIKGMIEVFGNANHKSSLIMRPDKPNAPQYVMDITPAREELGYVPQYNYIDMLKDFKKEMEKQRHTSGGGQLTSNYFFAMPVYRGVA